MNTFRTPEARKAKALPDIALLEQAGAYRVVQAGRSPVLARFGRATASIRQATSRHSLNGDPSGSATGSSQAGTLPSISWV